MLVIESLVTSSTWGLGIVSADPDNCADESVTPSQAYKNKGTDGQKEIPNGKDDARKGNGTYHKEKVT